MADITLGSVEHKLTVLLSPGADFVSTIEAADGEPEWPTGQSLELRIGSMTWTASRVDARTYRWSIDKTQVDALLATSRSIKAELWAIDGTSDQRWAAGVVEARG